MQRALLKKFRNHEADAEDLKVLRNQQCISEFRIQDLFGIAMIFVVTGIAISYGLSAQEDAQTDIYNDNSGIAGCNASDKSLCGSAYDAAGHSINGTAKLAEKMPMIATIVVAAIVIGVLVTYFVVRAQ